MSNSDERYFNLHITGCGYLQRARELKPQGRGKRYWAVTVVALVGEAENAERRYIDCIVRGEEALRLVKDHMEAINDRNRSVFVRFCAGDIWADPFIRKNDGRGPDAKKVGEPDAALKGRLIRIDLMKVDKAEVHRAEKPENAAATA